MPKGTTLGTSIEHLLFSQCHNTVTISGEFLQWQFGPNSLTPINIINIKGKLKLLCNGFKEEKELKRKLRKSNGYRYVVWNKGPWFDSHGYIWSYLKHGWISLSWPLKSRTVIGTLCGIKVQGSAPIGIEIFKVIRSMIKLVWVDHQEAPRNSPMRQSINRGCYYND